jgi:acetylornithine deacetylase/succinyl-diaminopimelate desuccinylase-like protein
LPDELRERILDPERVEEVIEQIPDDTLARFLHAATHTTLTPTMMEAGVKTNVICDTAVIDFDCRSLPGQTEEDVLAVMRDALGDLADGTEITFERGDEANSSPIDTPLWDILQRHAEDIVPGARNVPALLFGGTDSRHLRKLGATCYGYGAYSDAVDFSTFAGMFHGPNERIDQESLRRSTELWIATARDLLG